MSGRGSILGTIRQGLGRGELGVVEKDALETRIAAHERGIRPDRIDNADLKHLFIDCASKVDVTVDRVVSLDDVPA